MLDRQKYDNLDRHEGEVPIQIQMLRWNLTWDLRAGDVGSVCRHCAFVTLSKERYHLGSCSFEDASYWSLCYVTLASSSFDKMVIDIVSR